MLFKIFLGTMIIFMLSAHIVRYFSNKKLDVTKEIRANIFSQIIGIAGGIMTVGCIAMIKKTYAEDNFVLPEILILLLPFGIAAVWGWLYSANVYVKFNNRGFVYRSLLRKKYNCTYRDVEKIQKEESGISIWCKGKKIKVDCAVLTDCVCFCETVRKYCTDVKITHYLDKDEKMQRFVRNHKLGEVAGKNILDRFHDWMSKY